MHRSGLTTEKAVWALCQLVKKAAIDNLSENDCRSIIEMLFIKYDVVFRKHYALAEGYVPAFYLPRTKLVLDIKADKSLSRDSIYRECERYCLSDDVSGLVMASGIQGLPSSIHGKPTGHHHLGNQPAHVGELVF